MLKQSAEPIAETPECTGHGLGAPVHSAPPECAPPERLSPGCVSPECAPPGPKPAQRAQEMRLVHSILSGEEDFTRLYEAHAPQVYRFFVRRTGDPDEAEDLTQDVFLVVHRSLSDYRGEAPLAGWIYGITRNHYRGHCRRLRLSDMLRRCLQGQEESSPAPERSAEARCLLRRFEANGAALLTPREHRLVALLGESRSSIRDIAKALGASEASAKTRIHRLRRRMIADMPEVLEVLRVSE